MAGGKKAPNSRRFALFSHSLSHRKSVGFGAGLLRGSAAQTPENQRFRVIVTTAKNPSRGYKTAKKWETKKTTSHGICLGGGIPKDTDAHGKRVPSLSFRHGRSFLCAIASSNAGMSTHGASHRPAAGSQTAFARTMTPRTCANTLRPLQWLSL
jgi:hypothetical protein